MAYKEVGKGTITSSKLDRILDSLFMIALVIVLILIATGVIKSSNDHDSFSNSVPIENELIKKSYVN
jgi:hypothetical protein